MIKLSHRLRSISALINKPYDHVWDCCCDHGHLGMQLLIEQKAPHIHFVDIVPSLMSELETTLTRHFPKNQDNPLSNWDVHCMDVAALPLDEYQGTQLIVIAGVGGELTQKLVDDIISRHPNAALDFLLCPVHQQFELRNYLGQRSFKVIDEKLIEENRRFYEILHIAYQPEQNDAETAYKVSAVGDKIWLASNEQDEEVIKQYKKRTLQHYLRISQGLERQGKPDSVAHIIERYQAV